LGVGCLIHRLIFLFDLIECSSISFFHSLYIIICNKGSTSDVSHDLCRMGNRLRNRTGHAGPQASAPETSRSSEPRRISPTRGIPTPTNPSLQILQAFLFHFISVIATLPECFAVPSVSGGDPTLRQGYLEPWAVVDQPLGSGPRHITIFEYTPREPHGLSNTPFLGAFHPSAQTTRGLTQSFPITRPNPRVRRGLRRGSLSHFQTRCSPYIFTSNRNIEAQYQVPGE